MSVKEGLTGVTAQTPKNTALGAGTIHIGLEYKDGSWNFAETCIGATKGGNSFEYVPEIYEVEPDGLGISVKGLTVIVGAEGTLTINGLEVLKPELIRAAMIGEAGESEDASLEVYVPKAHIEEGDYFKNISFVGRTLSNEKIIIVLENALCTSGFKLDGQSKEANPAEYTFKCHADLDGDLETLPIKVYRPKSA